MDPEIAALAGTAGATLVTLLATEAWQSVRDGVVALWQRAQPDRVPVITTELATAREDLLRAEDANDEVTPAELRAEWQGRVRRLLATHPELAEDLRTLLTEFTAVDAPGPAVAQHATASGQGRVYQAGRDMHLGQG